MYTGTYLVAFDTFFRYSEAAFFDVIRPKFSGAACSSSSGGHAKSMFASIGATRGRGGCTSLIPS